VLLFKRIFDFKRATLARLRDKRRAKRYPVAPGFPLKASINLLGVDNPSASRAPADSGFEWGGAVLDVSSEGLSLRLPPACTTARGERTILTLRLGDFVLRIPSRVAHFRVQSANAACGLSLQFTDQVQQKAYQQLVEAMVIGAEFTADKPRREGNQRVECYRSERRTVLTVWRQEPDLKPCRFELLLGEHHVAGEANRLGLTITARRPDGAKDAAGAGRTDSEHPEVLFLYRLVAANLSRHVPADLRNWMNLLAVPPPAPRRPVPPVIGSGPGSTAPVPGGQGKK
jgi:hypothetical protein